MKFLTVTVMETSITNGGISVLDVVRAVLWPEKNTKKNWSLAVDEEGSNGNSSQCESNDIT